jgi:hypothetical protein
VTEWHKGQRCLVLELNGVTRRPKRGGAEIPATVEKVGAVYVQAKLRNGAIIPFWKRNGMQAHSGDFKWRLVAAKDTAAAAGKR